MLVNTQVCLRTSEYYLTFFLETIINGLENPFHKSTSFSCCHPQSVKEKIIWVELTLTIQTEGGRLVNNLNKIPGTCNCFLQM